MIEKIFSDRKVEILRKFENHCFKMSAIKTPILVFPPGKSGRKISREIWGFWTSRFQGNLCRDPGKFFYSSKNFSGTDIYHSDIKNALLQIKKFFFYLLKFIFQNSQNFGRQMVVRSKIFPQFVEKIEKLKLNLS